MKKILFAAIAVLGLSLTGSMCDTDGSGGGDGGMFGGGGDNGISSWEMLFSMPVEPAPCDASFVQSGAYLGAAPGQDQISAVEPWWPEEMFMYHLPVVVQKGREYFADVPEFHALAYVYAGGMPAAPGAAGLALPFINPGDRIAVHFRYRAEADARNGDFFEMRIYDGDFMMRPELLTSLAFGINVSSLEQARGHDRVASYAFTARTNNIGLLFMVGLSSPADQFFLDDLIVIVNGQVVLFDDFEDGNYTVPSFAGMFMRIPMLPPAPAGSMALQDQVVLEGNQSLAFTGGRYFVLYGLGASYDGTYAVMFSFSDPNVFDPFYGEALTALQGTLLAGRYQGWSRSVPEVEGWCTEGGLSPPFPPNILIGPGLSIMDFILGGVR